MKFELEESQLAKLKEWQKQIKKKHGKYGTYDFVFTPVGIGTCVKVVSHLTNKVLDLSEVEKW